MLDTQANTDVKATASALLLFDRAMTMQSIRSDIVRAAQELNRLTDHQLSELGINRSDIDDTIERYI
ncbi:DUF1127 domain-containing protein [Ruegeria lacuscaerulensis]|uniref:DUF1127 domain-containing protein n=1 Tax=Ruegeria lacuscaerulensis TaxID=55218 RepID=UPI00147F4DE4|nr:DUF1127 domain-containing protein [Ruegeria lacuscaerulensis]